ncbi:cytochrome-c oxidase, cbb3-type subunit III [Notoacmeibacter sp. MSK16QG-6]|uniref:cytochrome-c oxidase, cbb3-type subunit III n=1 Tax=Notoacmeibacter sp. MSK16QG-6 TaxID=2957982 RepID=UPI00209D0F60|nr:cytochrome-c oxidase, cbb3-type subunit III [Notoacmeibacter sp. MSK16QG-6]MCP1198655.1 cytochrome-c oxidase, cbb3-type subunit III [Notoacmeibacter sp. MSK16QG-6]
MSTENRDPHGREVDDVTGTETTGHEWDGIKELNTPMPRWWLWTFYATIVFGIVYTILYPAWPLVNTATSGLLNWSSRSDLSTAMAAQADANSGRIEAIKSKSIEEIAADEQLRPFAIAAGRAAFKVNCVQCHGAGAEGGEGYPNLNDDVWLWGGTLESIQTTLAHGIRYEQDDDTRISDMPAFGDGILDNEEIRDVAWYVRKLSAQEFDAEAAERGETIFVDNCSACHGDDGGGLDDLGAPALNDALWLYGGDHSQIVAQVRQPKHGVMPAWEERLGDTTVKQLTVYVHSLGGGE